MGKRMNAPAMLEITLDEETARTVVHLVGEIDAASSGRLRAVLGEQVAEDRDAVIDLAGVRFIDSSGLGVLVASSLAVATCRSGPRLRLCSGCWR
jgi:anti-anti-sigma factor